MGMRLKLLLVFCITALCILLLIPLVFQPAPDLSSSVAKAIDFYEDIDEPDALLMGDVMYRRFGIEAFAGSLQLYDQILSENPDQAPLMRVFRRMADYYNVLEDHDLEAVQLDTDLLTVPALYCDRLELPMDYSGQLVQGANLGNYMLTHALLACIWIQENGCEVPLSDDLMEALYLANAELINEDDVVIDLELEAAAFLYLAGQENLVKGTFIDKIIAVQNSDGGWSQSSNRRATSDWHTTSLALLVLLHVEYPSSSYPPMLSPASE